jgi:hypothetical protein
MTAIWARSDDGWKTLVTAGFPVEARLHGLVEEAPELLPLSGGARLTVVGREVPIGPWFADLVAVEPDGRIAIIEVKLARNSEARRAVVAQVLSYAAFLQGTGRGTGGRMRSIPATVAPGPRRPRCLPDRARSMSSPAALLTARSAARDNLARRPYQALICEMRRGGLTGCHHSRIPPLFRARPAVETRACSGPPLHQVRRSVEDRSRGPW